MTPRFRRIGATSIALAGMFLLSACGGEDKADAPKAAATPASAAAAASSAGAGKAAGGAKLAIAKSAALGDVVVDAQGFTLYRFDKDTAEPPKSNCAAGCLSLWPAAITKGKPDASGVDAALVGTLKLADGTEQVTLGGWPLYRYAPDAKAGDTSGQGVGEVWWAVTPTGEKAAAGAQKSAARY